MALTDNTWRKAHPQKGFRKGGLRPLVYSLASTRQIAPGYHSDTSFAGFENNGDVLGGDFNLDDSWTSEITRATPQFITPRLTSLGWLDTRNVLQVPVTVEEPIDSSEIGDASFVTQVAMAEQNDVTLPKIFMGVILLPPAYKTEQYFRMIINHHFAFKGFRGISLRNDQVGNGALPGNVVNANSGYSDNMNADGWIEGFSGDQPYDPPSPVVTEVTTNLTWACTGNWSGTLTVVTKNTPESTGLTETSTINLANSKTIWDAPRVLPVGATVTMTATGAQGNVSCTAVTYEIQPDGTALALEFNMKSSQANSLGTTAVYSS